MVSAPIAFEPAPAHEYRDRHPGPGPRPARRTALPGQPAMFP